MGGGCDTNAIFISKFLHLFKVMTSFKTSPAHVSSTLGVYMKGNIKHPPMTFKQTVKKKNDGSNVTFKHPTFKKKTHFRTLHQIYHILRDKSKKSPQNFSSNIMYAQKSKKKRDKKTKKKKRR
jgi:hypothetical protein